MIVYSNIVSSLHRKTSVLAVLYFFLFVLVVLLDRTVPLKLRYKMYDITHFLQIVHKVPYVLFQDHIKIGSFFFS